MKKHKHEKIINQQELSDFTFQVDYLATNYENICLTKKEAEILVKAWMKVAPIFSKYFELIDSKYKQ